MHDGAPDTTWPLSQKGFIKGVFSKSFWKFIPPLMANRSVLGFGRPWSKQISWIRACWIVGRPPLHAHPSKKIDTSCTFDSRIWGVPNEKTVYTLMLHFFMWMLCFGASDQRSRIPAPHVAIPCSMNCSRQRTNCWKSYVCSFGDHLPWKPTPPGVNF